MPSDMTSLARARQRWPKHPNGLSAPVRAVLTAWEQCQQAEQDEALDQIDGFTRPPPVDSPPNRNVGTSLYCGLPCHTEHGLTSLLLLPWVRQLQLWNCLPGSWRWICILHIHWPKTRFH
jgi:hypothetical protein